MCNQRCVFHTFRLLNTLNVLKCLRPFRHGKPIFRRPHHETLLPRSQFNEPSPDAGRRHYVCTLDVRRGSPAVNKRTGRRYPQLNLGRCKGNFFSYPSHHASLRYALFHQELGEVVTRLATSCGEPTSSMRCTRLNDPVNGRARSPVRFGRNNW